MSTGTFYPAVSGDDGFVSGAMFYPATAYLSMGLSAAIIREAWIRFTVVAIPQGATITSAFVRLTAQASQSNVACKIDCHLNDIDDAIAPTDYAEFAALSLTAGVAWDGLPAWTDGTTYDTPSIISEVQSIVDRVGFSSGNAMMLILANGGSDHDARRSPSAIDEASGTEKAELHVEWTVVEDTEVILTEPLLATGELQGNIQIDLVAGILEAVSSLTVGEISTVILVDCDPFIATGSLASNIGLEVVLNPLLAQAQLQGNTQIEVVPGTLQAQGSMTISEIFRGTVVLLPSLLSAVGSLQANTQIELVSGILEAVASLESNLGIEVSAGVLEAVAGLTITEVSLLTLEGLPRVYLFIMTGAENGLADVTIPMSSFQSRLRDTDPTFLSVVIPGLDYLDQINARPDGYLKVMMGYKRDGVIIISEQVAKVEFEDLRYDEGAVNQSITLTGHVAEVYETKTIILEEISYLSYADGEYTVRCKPDLYLRPGDHVIADDVSFDVTLISYSVSTTKETYQVTGE